MKVCFDLSAAVQQGAGISRYQRQLAKALVELNGAEPYSFFYTSPQPLAELPLDPRVAALPHRAQIVGNKQWRLRFLADFLLRRRYDKLVFSVPPTPDTIFHGMDVLTPRLNVPSVITVHDLSFLLYPELHSRYNRMYLRLLLPLCVKEAKMVIADSENTRRDLLNWLGQDLAEKVRAVPLGVSNETFFEDLPPEQLTEILKRYGLASRAFILGVGTIEPRKNYTALLQAYAELIKKGYDLSLIIVGKVGWQNEYERLKSLAEQYGLSVQENSSPENPPKQVIFLRSLNDSDLRGLYQAAKIFCYPSLYEGFGLPVLEAMAAGLPVVTSNISSLPEVSGPDGEAALLIQPRDIGEQVTALQKLLDNPELAQRLRGAARDRARLFTWRRCAELTHKVYEECLNVKSVL